MFCWPLSAMAVGKTVRFVDSAFLPSNLVVPAGDQEDLWFQGSGAPDGARKHFPIELYSAV